MPKKITKRRLRLQLTFVYGIMILAVVAIVAVLVLVVQGYRFNRYDGRLEQGGLVQFDSRPSGATVTADNSELANKTASKIVLSAGNHTVTIGKDGYSTWKKDVIVKPGKVLWLNYALLFPTNPKVSTAAKYTAVASALPSPNEHTMAVVANASAPEITLTALNTDSPTTTKLTIPAAAYTQPTDGVTQGFSLVEWDKDSHLLLVKHTVNDVQEYISVDTRDASRAVNVSGGLGVSATTMHFALNDSNIVYMLTASHELRRGSLSSMTLSGPLATGVSSFSVSESDVIVYETLPDANDQRIVGYVSSDSGKAKVLSSYSGLGGSALLASSGSYYGDHYVVILHGETLDILQGDLPSSDNNAILSLAHYASLTVAGGADYLDFSPDNNRMVYVAKAARVTTYDLELKNAATTTLQRPLTRDIQWLDGYHMMSANKDGYYYDYDGTNSQKFAANVLDLPAALESGNKYLYYFTQTGTETVLNRVRMTTDS